ncbi:MAG: hypothetical protein QF634_12850 [Vicinamibacterales bacterium]|nr:hypothetical protein [Vicinamibacterales bacterium]
MSLKSSSSLALLATALVLLGSASAAAQDGETDRIRVFVFCADERPEDAVVDPKLPPGEWQLEPMTWGPEGNSYYFKLNQALYHAEQLARQLGRTDSRRELMEVVETREEADLFLEVVATSVKGMIQGAGIRSGTGQTASSSVTTSAIQDVLIARLTIRNNVFTSDFLGTKVDALRTPAVTAAQQIEEFIKVNFDALRQAVPRS